MVMMNDKNDHLLNTWRARDVARCFIVLFNSRNNIKNYIYDSAMKIGMLRLRKVKKIFKVVKSKRKKTESPK